MKALLRGGLLSLLCLTTFATSASAECAWVLWISTEKLDWTIGGGGGEVYPTYAKCRARMTQITNTAEEGPLTDWVQWVMSTGPYDPKHPPYAKDFVGAYRMREGVVVTDGKGYSEWRCLPETMDPRGPKGK